MIISTKNGNKFDETTYDQLFHSIENNLRESGLGEVSVNKKMKDLNKILYDILLKIECKKTDINNFNINFDLISRYFNEINNPQSEEFKQLAIYFDKFYHFCFELSLTNMLNNISKFKY